MEKFPRKTLVAITALAVTYFVVCARSIPPSDDDLEQRFFMHRDDMNQLLLMAEHDAAMTRISPDFNYTHTWSQSKPGISCQRWNEYRSLFRKAGIKHGFSQDRARSRDVRFFVWAHGLSISQISVEFVHCGPPKTHIQYREPPCLEQKDTGSGRKDNWYYHYKKITDSWYIYVWSD